MKSILLLTVAFIVGLITSISTTAQEEGAGSESNSETTEATSQEPEEKKLTIKDIMKLAHGKDGLTKKVATGKADDKQKKELQSLYEKMSKLKQPKGTDKSWKEKNKALVDAAKLAVKGDPTAAKKLKAASNCKSCHKLHK